MISEEVRKKPHYRATPVGDGHDGMREIVELKAVSGCVADFGRIVAWALVRKAPTA
jgi:hypothetical protein